MGIIWIFALSVVCIVGFAQGFYVNKELLPLSHVNHDVICARSAEFSPSCTAAVCGRHVFDNLFPEEDIIRLHAIASKGLALRESVGGPSIIDINTGYVRDSNGLENLFLRNEPVYSDDDFAHYGSIIRRLKQQVMDTFQLSELYFTAPTFITRLDGRESWEPQGIHDEYWHVHADMNNTAHYQYSGLLYMSTYEEDFTGGKVHFVSKDDHSAIEDTIEPRAGRTLIFTSDAENPHYVDRLLSGNRFVLAFWFTCDQAREFEIFLDGKAHTTFSHSMRDRLLQHQNAKSGSKQQSAEAQRKRHRKKTSYRNSEEL